MVLISNKLSKIVICCICAFQHSFVTPLTSLVVVKPNATSLPVDTETVRPGTNDHIVPTGLRTAGLYL